VNLTDKTALVTGTRRVGAVVARELAARGADVAVAYRTSRAEAEATMAAVRALGRRGEVIQADLSRQDGCMRLVAEAAARFGRLDILVHAASRYERRAFAELTESDWDAALAVDLKAAWACAAAAVPHMRRAGGGRIVNVADWVAASGRPRYRGYLAYYVAKRALIALTEALALELAPDGILVNAVAPGPIEPPPDLSEAERRAVERETPLGRWGGAPEVARAVAALVESDFITGETIRVDGGRHLR
jgi:NAD(P)-dependent dehydrogenase (short-subunit alcohol dehydrogenase family)